MEEILTDMIEKLQDENAQLTAECERLRLALIDNRETIARLISAIRKHRDAKDDDRCWLDDQGLYSVLPEGGQYDSSLPPECEFLESCRRFWAQRQVPVDRDWRPEEMTIAQLQATIARLIWERDAVIGYVRRVGVLCEQIGAIPVTGADIRLLAGMADEPTSTVSSGGTT